MMARNLSERFVLVAALFAGLVILGAGAFLALSLHETPRGAAGTLLASAIGGPFRLVDQNTLDYCYSEAGPSPRSVCARLARQR